MGQWLMPDQRRATRPGIALGIIRILTNRLFQWLDVIVVRIQVVIPLVIQQKFHVHVIL